MSASQVKQVVCHLLEGLARNRVSIDNNGDMAAIMSGMEAHHDHAGVQEYGYWALYNLSSSNLKVTLLVEVPVAGGVQVLKAASTYQYCMRTMRFSRFDETSI